MPGPLLYGATSTGGELRPWFNWHDEYGRKFEGDFNAWELVPPCVREEIEIKAHRAYYSEYDRMCGLGPKMPQNPEDAGHEAASKVRNSMRYIWMLESLDDIVGMV